MALCSRISKSFNRQRCRMWMLEWVLQELRVTLKPSKHFDCCILQIQPAYCLDGKEPCRYLPGRHFLLLDQEK